MDAARRQGLQKGFHTLADRIRTDAEGRYGSESSGWQAGVDWTLLCVENMAGGLAEGRS